MKPMVVPLLLAAAIAVSVGLAASERGTPAEAKAMLQKAVAHYKSVGRQRALADFTGKKAPFADRDLYVACRCLRGRSVQPAIGRKRCEGGVVCILQLIVFIPQHHG